MLAHFMHFDRETCVFAGQVFCVIIGWEFNIHIKFIAGFVANNLVFESWDKCARSQYQMMFFGCAAFECFVANKATKIYDRCVAILCNVFIVLFFGNAARFTNVFQCFFNFGLVQSGCFLGHSDFFQINGRHCWQNIKFQCVFCITAHFPFCQICTWRTRQT